MHVESSTTLLFSCCCHENLTSCVRCVALTSAGNLEAFSQIQSQLATSYGETDKEWEALPIRFTLLGFDLPLERQPALLRTKPKQDNGKPYSIFMSFGRFANDHR